MRKFLFILISLACMSFILAPKNGKVYLVGDSTMQNYDPEKTYMQGWGKIFSGFFPEGVCINKGRGGRSSRSYMEEGLWSNILTQLKKGDWVLIQFAHNDQSTSRAERYTSPDDFRNYLMRYVAETRAYKAHPVLVTHTLTRSFDANGKLQGNDNLYAEITRQVAQVMNVPLIDMRAESLPIIESMGAEPSKAFYNWPDYNSSQNRNSNRDVPAAFFRGDDTHLSTMGATRLAEIALQSAKDQKLKGLIKLLKPEYK